MNKWILILVVGVSVNAQAGGLALGKKYSGSHPLTGSVAELQITDSYMAMSQAVPAALRVSGSAIHAGDLTIVFESENRLETVFEVRDASGQAVGRLVTEPPCTMAEHAVLVMNSGVSIPLKKVAP